MEIKRIYIEEARDHVGEEVELRGWLYNKRSSGKIHFIILRDGSGFMQCVVVKGSVPDEVFELYDELTLESSMIVRGKVREDARAPGGYELDVTSMELVHKAIDYPITKKEHGIGFLLPIRHLWLRSRKQWALMRIRAELESAIEDFFNNRGFVRIDAPILTPASVEGTTTLFETDYFGEKAYLSQSGQLYMEAACMAHGRVYCFGPTFRAEKSKTRRHLMEFWMVEPEIAWAVLDDIMKLAEEFVSYLVERILERRMEELKYLERDTAPLESVRPPFPRISYTQAVEILKENGMQFEWGEDFGGDEETVISKSFDRPVIVHRYPARIKAFYMKRDPENQELALGMDMLAPEGYGEIIGGGQREEDLSALEERLREFNLPKESYEWYLDLRRYGSVPHSGFGLGLERTIAWIAGIPHVREAIPFPRLLEKIYP
ncbi:MAG TPA: asparagine--tRNA ligase [candidate division WOR-3 bacterium]|uniref:Asparagine--tRNA ligase n=1 Tax=candidate division WOR-3 bacterium TaxID=2052148 RepID=A0A7C0XBR3_UNCW3|nr:asparagine--tRNA ligase [candidate division WOR-3 bacterium]